MEVLSTSSIDLGMRMCSCSLTRGFMHESSFFSVSYPPSVPVGFGLTFESRTNKLISLVSDCLARSTRPPSVRRIRQEHDHH